MIYDVMIYIYFDENMMKKYDDDLFKRPHTHTPLTQSNSSQQSLVVSFTSLVVKTLTFPLVSSSSQ